MGIPHKDQTPEQRKKQRDYYRDVWYPKNKARHHLVSRTSMMKRKLKVNQYKVEKGCTDCGYNTDPWALEFDHIGTDKSYGIAAHIQAKSWENLRKEIDKCEVVCANCHRIRTKKRLVAEGKNVDPQVFLDSLGVMW